MSEETKKKSDENTTEEGKKKLKIKKTGLKGGAGPVEAIHDSDRYAAAIHDSDTYA